MLQSIVGPPNVGVADFKSQDKFREAKGNGSDSFGSVLGEKESPKYNRNKDEVAPESANSSRTNPSRSALPERVNKTESKESAPEDRDRSESEDSSVPAAAQTNEGIVQQQKGGHQRQQAILKFMDSFESEFGVPPTKMVEAMAKLKPSEQRESPEDTVNQVIGKLDLDDEQKDRAKAMYSGLLAQLTQIDQKQKTEPPPKAMFAAEAMGAKSVQDRFGSKVEKHNTLNHSLDHMNQRFWMKDGAMSAAHRPGEVGGDGLADKLAQMNLQEKLAGRPGMVQVDEESFRGGLRQPQASGGATANGSVQEMDEGEEPSSPEEALAGLVAAARAAKARELQGDDDAPSIDEGGDPRMEHGGGMAEVGAGKLHVQQEKAAFDPNSQAQSGREQHLMGQQHHHGSQEGMSMGSHHAKSEIAEKSKIESRSDFQKMMATDDAAGARPLEKHAEGDASLIANVNTKPTAAENEANVRQIMNQAQYLIKKGGGEMKVEMTPEGLGQIHMKVAVQDGKVNLQMQATSPEAKKALESGMSELKNSLAAHKLSMDHVKVDVVNKPNTENNTNQQMNQQNAREQTRQFWNHFSDSFGSPSQQRDNFTDIPNMRGYAQHRGDEPLRPVETSSVRKYAAAGKGRGLDLVA